MNCFASVYRDFISDYANNGVDMVKPKEFLRKLPGRKVSSAGKGTLL